MPEPVSTEFAQWLVTLGVGGVLAAFMFVFYRKDVKQYTELWKAQSDKTDALVNILMGVVKENTASNTRLIALIEELKLNSLRKSDIDTIVENKITQTKYMHSRTSDNP